MAIIEGRTWLEVLPPHRCWDELTGRGVGRLAFLHEGAPEVLPVNYAVDDESIVFRIDHGTKLSSLGRDDRVAFEVDGIDHEARTGWSVIVKGRARRVTGAAEMGHLRGLGLEPWAVGAKDHWYRIEPTSVTGRSVHDRGDRHHGNGGQP